MLKQGVHKSHSGQGLAQAHAMSQDAAFTEAATFFEQSVVHELDSFALVGLHLAANFKANSN